MVTNELIKKREELAKYQEAQKEKLEIESIERCLAKLKEEAKQLEFRKKHPTLTKLSASISGAVKSIVKKKPQSHSAPAQSQSKPKPSIQDALLIWYIILKWRKII